MSTPTAHAVYQVHSRHVTGHSMRAFGETAFTDRSRRALRDPRVPRHHNSKLAAHRSYHARCQGVTPESAAQVCFHGDRGGTPGHLINHMGVQPRLWREQHGVRSVCKCYVAGSEGDEQQGLFLRGKEWFGGRFHEKILASSTTLRAWATRGTLEGSVVSSPAAMISRARHTSSGDGAIYSLTTAA